MERTILDGFTVTILCGCGRGTVRLTLTGCLYHDEYCEACGRVYTASVTITEHPEERYPRPELAGD